MLHSPLKLSLSYNFVVMSFSFHIHIAYRLDSTHQLKWQLLHMISALILVLYNFYSAVKQVYMQLAWFM